MFARNQALCQVMAVWTSRTTVATLVHLQRLENMVVGVVALGVVAEMGDGPGLVPELGMFQE